MSGQLVGEILDAVEAGHLAGLSQGELLALLAVAEKCHTRTRQGSVRLGRIAAALGRSQATAKRTTKKLRDRGLIEVVKRGYRSHGVGHATVFRLAMLGSPLDEPSTTPDAGITPGVSRAPVSLGSPMDEPSVESAGLKNGMCSAQNGHVLGSPMGELHDGLYDGLYDGGRARDDKPRCAKHADPDRFPNPPDCPDCGEVRKRRDRLRAERERTERELIRQAREECTTCEGEGTIEITDNSVARCPECSTPEARQRLAEMAQALTRSLISEPQSEGTLR